MDGGAVAAQIKNQRPHVPVIMLSAYPGARDSVRDLVDAFIEKGGDPTLLLGKLESLIKTRSHSHPELKSEYVVFADASRHFLDCSDAVCKLLGYSRSEILERRIDEVSYKPEEVPALFEDFRKRGNADGEFVLKNKNGRPLLVRFHSLSFADGCLAAVWAPVSDWRE